MDQTSGRQGLRGEFQGGGKNDKRSELVGLNQLISQLLKFTLRPKKVKFKKL